MECHHHEDGKAAQVAQGQARLGHGADCYRISSYRQSTPRYRTRSRASKRPAAFSHRCHYALIRRPYNECLPGSGKKLAVATNRLIAAFTAPANGLRRAWAAIRATDERAGRASAFGPAPLEKVAQSQVRADCDGSAPAQAHRNLCSTPAGRDANDC